MRFCSRPTLTEIGYFHVNIVSKHEINWSPRQQPVVQWTGSGINHSHSIITLRLDGVVRQRVAILRAMGGIWLVSLK